MIEALIDPNTGDVIVAKQVGSVWGRREVNRVVNLDDPALEAECAEHGPIVWPYAARETIAGPRPMSRLLERSLVKIDVAAASISSDVSTKLGVLVAADADTPVVEAKISEVKPLPEGAVVEIARDMPSVKEVK